MVNIQKPKQKKSLKELLEFGIINIDKASGPTSINVSDFVREKLGLRKTSHFGTLDPKVTGVLPIALNKACKLTGFFLGEDKEYIGIMRIHKDVSLKEIEKAIKEKFIGKIKQTPPVKSRIKRQERLREIKRFDLIEKSDKDVLFRVECEAGTYIRKLISDLGDYMKIGAHMLELRRVRAGIFKEEDSINLYDFEKAVDEYLGGRAISRVASKNSEVGSWAGPLQKIIISAEIVSEVYPIVEIKKDNLKQIFTGKPIHKKDLVKKEKRKKNEIVCVFCEERFIGMYKIVNDKDIFAKAEFVMREIK